VNSELNALLAADRSGELLARSATRRVADNAAVAHPKRRAASMPRVLVAAAVGIAAAVAVPSLAEAATIHKDGRTSHRLLLQDDTDQTNFVTVEGSRVVVFHDTLVPIKIDRVPTCISTSASGRTSRRSTRRTPCPSTAGPATIATTPSPPARGRA
jgi:hypothetical protein